MGDSDAVRALSRVQSRAGDRRRSAVLAGVLTLMLAAAGGCVARLADTDNAQDAAGKASWTDAEIEAMAREAREARPRVEQIEALIAQGRAPRPARTGQSRDVAIGLLEDTLTSAREEIRKRAETELETTFPRIDAAAYRPLRSIERKEWLEKEGALPDPVLASWVERMMSALASSETESVMADLPGTDLPAVLEHAPLLGRYSSARRGIGHVAGDYALAVLRASVLAGDLPRFERASAALLAILESRADTAAGGDGLGSMIFEELSLRVTAHMDFAARARPEAAWLKSIDRTLERMPNWNSEQFLRWAEMAWLEYICTFYSNPANIRRGWGSMEQGGGEEFDRAAKSASMLVLRSRDSEKFRRMSFADARAALGEEVERVRKGLAQERWTKDHVSGFDNEGRTLWTELTGISIGSFVSAPLAEISRRGVRVAVRVDQFRLETGRLPTQAEFDGLFAAVPWAVDPYNGALLRYKVLAEPADTIDRAAPTIDGIDLRSRGFVVYSVGLDGVDNGANPVGPIGRIIGMLRADLGGDVLFPLLR